jgi:integrase
VFLNRGVEISFLRSACVKAARSATYLLWRATHPDEKSRALPISMDMIMDAENRSLNSGSLEDRSILVALKLAFVCLLRVSEYLPMGTEHYLRGRDIVFIFRGEHVGEEILVASDKLGDRSVKGLLGVIVNVRSSKTDTLAEGHRFHFYVVDTVGTMVNISVVLFEWAKLVRPEKDGPFLGGVSRSCLSYDVYNKAIKRLAYELGLNPKYFSTHSCRVGGATALGAAGVPDYLIQNLGRWKSLAFLGYVRCSVRACSIAMRALSDPTLVTVADVRKMVPGVCR